MHATPWGVVVRDASMHVSTRTFVLAPTDVVSKSLWAVDEREVSPNHRRANGMRERSNPRFQLHRAGTDGC